ncbi:MULTISPECIES: bacteriohemerythrin [Ramlibacter]|uniref:Hemerythrin-like domain-containing protein n=1 Tax=Ramlibacter pinisoli TaxID=2682844 RepID=A0A6N8IYR0_9BURK|nr:MULTISPECIES: hemerythrin domain-containing protein [Ramlibacter]MBA2961152.1 hypothetical protein [Ramlibacter sp. CGMCC 1.13660]MVQ31096.1 hypothetical protein [Ramlibacter pinisoli]
MDTSPPTSSLQWNPRYSLGNPLLDRQHILLFELTRSFAADVAQMSHETLAAAYGDILGLAQRHCAAEEQMLLVNGYEWLEQHRQEHVAGLDRLQAVWAAVACGDLSRHRLVLALQGWLVTHLQDMDLPAVEYLATDPRRVRDPDGPDPLDVQPGRTP